MASGVGLLSRRRIPKRNRQFWEAKIKNFHTKIRVYWSDCDSAGIAYYGNFFRFFEMAEEELYISLGGSRPGIFFQLQVGFPRVETTCRYHQPARVGDLLDATVWIARRTTRSMQFCFELRREGETELVAQGNYTIVCVTRQFKSVPFPEAVLQLLADYLPPLTEQPVPQAVKSE